MTGGVEHWERHGRPECRSQGAIAGMRGDGWTLAGSKADGRRPTGAGEEAGDRNGQAPSGVCRVEIGQRVEIARTSVSTLHSKSPPSSSAPPPPFSSLLSRPLHDPARRSLCYLHFVALLFTPPARSIFNIFGLICQISRLSRSLCFYTISFNLNKQIWTVGE